MQLSTRDEDIVVDALALRSHIGAAYEPFAEQRRFARKSFRFCKKVIYATSSRPCDAPAAGSQSEPCVPVLCT